MVHVLPEELYYTQNHEWLHVDENLATIGLTPYALNLLGEVLYLDLPEEGQNSTPGNILCTIESVLKIHDIVSSIQGTVLEINFSLLNEPYLVNDDPFGDGWLFRIEMDNERDLAALFRSKEYREFIGSTKKSNLVLADGGRR